MQRWLYVCALTLCGCSAESETLGLGASDGGLVLDAATPADAGPSADAGAAPDAGRCEDLDEAACAQSNCRSKVCTGCEGEPLFSLCFGEAEPSCPEVLCQPCEALEEVACRDAPDCHRVFEGGDPQDCFCDGPGCCHDFVRCAQGARADCVGEDLNCRSPEPWCEGPYVISYEGFCYEGCVRAEDCAP